MNDPLLMFILKISYGIVWSLVYIMIIKRGFNDKSYGMPMVALCANLSWEFIFSFVFPHELPQLYINIIWFSFDLIIMSQFLRFGKNEYKKWFYSTFLLTLIINFSIILSITIEFKDWLGKYAAFSQNLLMSILFISFLYKRNDIIGQSMYIAIFKALGTLLPSILFYIYYPSLLITLLSILIFIVDCIYVALLYIKFHDLGLNPWIRKANIDTHIAA
jgi:hypothetical protein